MDNYEFMQMVNDQFTAMDTNNDGKLSLEEVKIFEKNMRPALGKVYRECEVEAEFNAMDTDKSGFIE